MTRDARRETGRPSVEVLTPTYRPDLELCRDLNASIRRFGNDVVHRIVVPPRDLSLVASWQDDLTAVDSAAAFLPRSLRSIPRNLHVDVRRPWWPIRGWITQQIVKLEASARSESSIVVVADSDLVFIRSFGAESFSLDGRPMWFRLPGGVHAGMPRHLEWHRVARMLLGLPEPQEASPPPDYICWPCAWEPAVVRRMLERIESVHGRPWQLLVAAQRHFSEMILYGVYVDALEPDPSSRAATSEMRCRQHSDETSLDEPALRAFLATIQPDDLAVMISAKSGTDLETRRHALARISEPR